MFHERVTSEYSLIQFRVCFYEVGNRIRVTKGEEYFDPTLYFGVREDEDVADFLKLIEPSHESFSSGEVLHSDETHEVVKPFVHVSPMTYLGQWAGNYASALEHEVLQIGENEVFGDYLEEIVKIAQKHLVAKVKKVETKKSIIPPDDLHQAHEIIIATAWRYDWTMSGGYESVGLEYDGDWTLLGEVNLSEIGKIIVPQS